MHTTHHKQSGLTIIELISTLAIAAILLSLAAPPYQDFIKRNNVDSLQHRLAAAFITARSEAATRNVTVSICASSNGEDCSNDAWSDGWIVFIDKQTVGTREEKDVADAEYEEVLLAFDNTTSYDLQLYDDSPTEINAFTFDYRGYSYNDGRAMAVICEPNSEAKYTRGFTIERSGRIARSQGVSNAGDAEHKTKFDGDSNTRAIAC